MTHIRSGRVLADGGIYRKVTMASPKGMEASIESLEPIDPRTEEDLHNKLIKRDALIDALHALEGFAGRQGLLRYRITDCNLQIHGPDKWLLYVAWQESSLVPGRVSAERRFTKEMRCPCPTPTPAEVLDRVEAAVKANADVLASGIRAVGDFVSE